MFLASCIVFGYIGGIVGLMYVLHAFTPIMVTFVMYWILVGFHVYNIGNLIIEMVLGFNANKHLLKRIEKDPLSAALNSAPSLSNDIKLPVIVSALIVAYLPNEKDIILDTIQHFLKHVVFSCCLKHRVILVYNTPYDIPKIENALEDLEREYEGVFFAVRVPNSTSKADNINYWLSLDDNRFPKKRRMSATLINDCEPNNHQELQVSRVPSQHANASRSGTHIVSIFDADHLPHPHMYYIIGKLFADDPELTCVQGRCMIRNANTNMLTYLVAAEFDMIYNVHHIGRMLFHGFGLFGGSNGHWDYQRLKELGFRKDMLTEDIDASIRNTLDNKKIKYDNLIVSFELAPTLLGAYFSQRTRWAQGWLQVLLKRLKKVGLVNAWKWRYGLVNLLLMREVSYHTNMWLTVIVVMNFILKADTMNLYALIPLIVSSCVYMMFYLVYVIACEYRMRMIVFLLCSMPYHAFHLYITLISEVYELIGNKVWRVTPRSNQVKPATDLDLRVASTLNSQIFVYGQRGLQPEES